MRPTTIRTYRFITENGYTPRIWKIQGSNDNVNWTTLHEVSVSWTWDDGKIKVQYDIPLENRAEYKYHRLQVDEFDSTSVRIYSLQFYDSLCETNSSFYLDASAENPLQLAFADGYNVDGTPKDIIKIITTSHFINLTEFSDNIEEALAGTDVINIILYSVYDLYTDSISFEAKLPLYQTPVNILKDYGCNILSHGAVLDLDLNSYFRIWWSGDTVSVNFTKPITTDRLWYVAQTYDGSKAHLDFKFSEDNGTTWSNTVQLLPGYRDKMERVYQLDRIYNINYVKFYLYGGMDSYRYTYLYEFSFYDAKEITDFNILNGKLYQHDYVNDVWNQVYKIPLGYFSLIRNPENTNWEIANFIPNNIPQMFFAPYFRKIIH